MIKRIVAKLKRRIVTRGSSSSSPNSPRKVAVSREVIAEKRIASYLEAGRVPWSVGYNEYKWRSIGESVNDLQLGQLVREGELPKGYGIGLDERIVEYLWSLNTLGDTTGAVLDAGSACNHEPIIKSRLLDAGKLTIAGLAVEKNCFYSDGVSYQVCDLREIPFRDDWFDATLSISTLEHIGMNNEIYGHADELKEGGSEVPTPSFEFLPAVNEIVRVTKPDGKIVITVPTGRFENHGFFQQFDRAMLDVLRGPLEDFGKVKEEFFLYSKTGWVPASWEECSESRSYNPHSGEGKGEDGAAHCRAVACFEVLGGQ